MSGRVTRPDDGATTDNDSDPDPFSGLTVHRGLLRGRLGRLKLPAGPFRRAGLGHEPGATAHGRPAA